MASPLASSSRAPMPASTSPPVVRRHGFLIPSIRLTPPDSRPHKSPECPEQDLSNATLYVPLRTAEIGWEEGGVIWGGRRPVYAYPTVNLYGGDDDHVIGTYRGGPKGYSFFTISDPNFSAESASDDCEEIKPPAQALRKADEPRPRRETGDEIESDRGCSSGSGSSRGRSGARTSEASSASSSAASSSEAALPKTPLPLAPISTSTLPLSDAPCVSSPTSLADNSDEVLSSAGSSAASSRRGSSSSDTDSIDDGDVDTGATTPASPPCGDAEMETAAAVADKTMAELGAQLETRLSALSRSSPSSSSDDDDEQEEEEADETQRPRKSMKLAARVPAAGGAVEESASAAPLKDTSARLSASFELDAAAPGATRTWPAGRGNSRPTAVPVGTNAFAGGSEYEANFV